MRGGGLLLALILSSPYLAGCVGEAPAALAPLGEAGLPEKLLDLGDIVEAKIPLGSNIALHGTVYLPDVPEGQKVPVILDLGPYYGNLGPETSVYNKDHPPSLLYEHFLRRGYAIALVSLRGTGQSGGCFMIGGPQENADAAAAVEWLAAQPWSDGNVGMTGVSYDGTTPWEALVSGAAPSLKAIVPVESITDHYRYSFFEGVPIGGGAAFNTYYEAYVDVTYRHVPGIPAWLAVQPSQICPEQAQVYLSPYQTYRDGVHGPFWDARDMTAQLDKAEAAVFVVQGFKDFNVKMDHVQTMWDSIPTPKRMLLGQWEHNIPWRNTYDKDMSWAEYNATILDFLEAYVRGDPAALARQQAAAPVLVQDSANRTWNLTRWPPAESALAPLQLAPEGKLQEDPAAEGRATIRPNPLARTPLAPVSSMHRASFSTDEHAETTRYFGNPEIRLNVTVDRPEGHLQAELWEVDSSGKRELVSLGWQNLVTRASRDKAESVPTGTPIELRLQMEAIAQVVEKGHKLVLVLTSENLRTMTPGVHVTTYQVHLGGEGGAQLLLPVFDAAAAPP